MDLRGRSTGRALLAVCGCLVVGLIGDQCLFGAYPVPGRTAQQVVPSSPEPPLAEAPLVPPPAPLPTPVPGTPCPVDPPVPAVALRVRVAAAAAAGRELEYHITVENRSRAPAHHVLVRDPVPANATFVRATPEPVAREPELLWQFGTLAPCAHQEIVLVLLPTGPGDVRNCARVQFEHGECVTTRVGGSEPPPAPTPTPPPAAIPTPPTAPTAPPTPAPAAALALSKQGPAEAILYDPLTFRLLVTNTSAAPLKDVAVTDTLPEGLESADGKNPLTWKLDTLDPGQTRTLEYQVIARRAGVLTNQATVRAAGGEHREARATVRVEPRMTLIETGPVQQFVSQPARYQLTVANPGTRPVSNVVLTAPVPEKMTFVGASSGYRLAGHQVEWRLGTLPPGGRRAVQVTLKAQAAGSVVQQATVKGDHGQHAETEFSTRFEGATGLTVDIENREGVVEVGAETVYTVTVLNQGVVPATGVKVLVTVPEQMDIRDATGPSDAHRQVQEHRVAFDPISVKPQEKAVYTIRALAKRAGDVRFVVELSANELTRDRPVRREQSTTIYNPLQPARP